MEKQRLGFRKRIFKVFFLSALGAVGAVSCAHSVRPSTVIDDKRNVRVDGPTQAIKEGELFYVTVHSSQDVGEVLGFFHGRTVVFYPDSPADSNDHVYSAVVGVEDGMGKKNAEMTVKVCTKQKAFAKQQLAHNQTREISKADSSMNDGLQPQVDVPSVDNLMEETTLSCSEHTIGVQTEAGVFPSETLKVPPRTIEPRPKDQVRIARELKLLRQIYGTQTKLKYWDPPAYMPVNLGITSQWGARRVYNGKVQSAHYGTDMRAPTGTPIKSPYTGKVVLSRHLFYTGNTVILDHGYGLFTLYGHMSKLRVKVGAVAKKGTVLGLSGMTGRASGPHLHWGVKLHDAKIDPMALARLLKP